MSVSQFTLTPPEMGGALNVSETRPPEICARIEIHAEAQRILYALSTPEYLEAWLHLPGVERFECHSELRSFDRFRLDLFSSSKRLPSIYGSCQLSKPNKVTYHWDQTLRGGEARALVDIQILGGAVRCSVMLAHDGIGSDSERHLHSMMWHHSLIKLRSLMERVNSCDAHTT